MIPFQLATYYVTQTMWPSPSGAAILTHVGATAQSANGLEVEYT